MLVLARKKGEDLIIKCPNGDLIKVGVWKEPNTSIMKIYVDAPQEYLILRKELFNGNKK